MDGRNALRDRRVHLLFDDGKPRALRGAVFGHGVGIADDFVGCFIGSVDYFGFFYLDGECLAVLVKIVDGNINFLRVVARGIEVGIGQLEDVFFHGLLLLVVDLPPLRGGFWLVGVLFVEVHKG